MLGYRTLNDELRKEFNEKIMKLSLDGGFTCPNRDGKKGYGGCIFCGEMGSGEFTKGELSIEAQAKEQIELLSKKWKANKYIAYFQNFTNTYAPTKDLRKIYKKALKIDGVVGIAIATRPDSIDDEAFDFFKELNRTTYLWIELGLQTIREDTAKIINRGYKLNEYNQTVNKLKENNIRTVTHLIAGLPNETLDDFLESVDYVIRTDTWGIKFASLYVQENTALAGIYNDGGLKLLQKQEYVEVAARALKMIGDKMVVHRITGDCKKDLLIAPKWSADKLSVISAIRKELALN